MIKRFLAAEEYEAWLRLQVKLKRPYWYACYYNRCSEALLQRKKKQYPAHYKDDRLPTYRKHIAAGQIAGDCVNGAIKGAIWSELGTREPVYASHDCPDKSADGMFEYCKSIGMPWGAISSIPEQHCVAVRFAGHVGIYIGNDEVIEWRGFAYGCVLTKLSKRPWTHWYELPWIIYKAATLSPDTVEGIPAVGTLGSRLLRKGSKGEDVRMLQRLLMQLTYELPKYGDDGDFGAETETALTNFQRAHGLTVDGIYGPNSHRELMGTLAEQEAQDDADDEDETEQPRRFVEVTGRSVCIREGAAKTFEIITYVSMGDRLEHVATAANGWHAIKLSDGRSGWIGPRYSALEVPAA